MGHHTQKQTLPPTHAPNLHMPEGLLPQFPSPMDTSCPALNKKSQGVLRGKSAAGRDRASVRARLRHGREVGILRLGDHCVWHRL